MNFNHPVKELIWVAQKEASAENQQHFNYTDAIDSSPTLTHNAQGSRMLQGIVENMTDGSDAKLKIVNEDQGNNTCNLAKIQQWSR